MQYATANKRSVYGLINRTARTTSTAPIPTTTAVVRVQAVTGIALPATPTDTEAIIETGAVLGTEEDPHKDSKKPPTAQKVSSQDRGVLDLYLLLDARYKIRNKVTQSIHLEGHGSTPLPIPFGVPQEPVPGALLFLVYVSKLPAETTVTGVTIEKSSDNQARVNIKPTSCGYKYQTSFQSLSSWARNADT